MKLHCGALSSLYQYQYRERFQNKIDPIRYDEFDVAGQIEISEKSWTSPEWFAFIVRNSHLFSPCSRSDRKKVHYTFDDQSEMVEEYDAKTNVLLSVYRFLP